MTDKSIVGDLINFRGLVYSPVNESGVVFLFGKLVEDLNMYIEEIKTGFPDCIARRFVGKGWERVAIEFEFKSSNFLAHKHDQKHCDIIVCWEHDWKDCPLEVIELKEVIAGLPNKPIPRGEPKGQIEPEQDGLLIDKIKDCPEQVQKLFELFDREIKNIDDSIWRQSGSTLISYYSPKRAFVYLRPQKTRLRLWAFTNGQKIEGIEKMGYEKAAHKWGLLFLEKEENIHKVIAVLKKSYELINQAIKNNEPTGWYAQVEDNEMDDMK
jgi:predicted transport protein